MKKLFVLLLVFSMFLVIQNVGADSIGNFKLNTDPVELYQICNNCTFCEFPRVMGPNNQTILSNLTTTRDGSYYYTNLASGNFTAVGDYEYGYVCGNGVENETGFIDFTISYTGNTFTQTTAIVYFIALGILVLFIIGILLFMRKLPEGNAVDERGVIIQISQLKHLRPLLWGIVWMLVVALMYIVSNMTFAYLPSFFLGKFFFMIFKIMFYVAIICVPLWWVWIFVRIFQDKEYKRLMERGVEIKTL